MRPLLARPPAPVNFEVPGHVQSPGDLYRAQIAGRVPPGLRFEQLRELRHLGVEDMPHVWPPPDSLTLNKAYAIACPAIASTGTTIGTFQPQPGWWAVVRWVALCQTGVGFAEGSGAMTWRILLSGNPVADYGNVTIQIGNLNGAIVPAEVGPIIVRPNTKVVLQVDNLSVNPVGVNVVGIVRGWEWPSRRTS